jgi:hypothetical protein
LRRQRFERRGGRSLPKPLNLTRNFLDESRERLANADRKGNWLSLIAIVAVSLGTLYLGYRRWSFAAHDPSAMCDQ